MTTLFTMTGNTINYDYTLSRLFLYLGFQPSRIGFDMLKSAVLLYRDGHRKLNDLFDSLAIKYDKSCYAIERNLRSMLDSAYLSGELYNINLLLGLPYLSKTQSLSTKEFLAIVSEYLDDPRLSTNSTTH